MKSKARPNPQDAAPGAARAVAPKAPRRAKLVRRLSTGLSNGASGLRRRMPSFGRTDAGGDLSYEKNDPAAPGWQANGEGADAAPALAQPAPSTLDDVDGDAFALACEVGQNAQDYLDECFDVEGAVLARASFDALTEIPVADLTIVDHIGKGSFCDVSTVVCKGGTSARREAGQTFAMKRLRRQVCADVDQFTMGAEDLVHETAALAGLSHPHIIKLHGRVAGTVANAFAQPGGYFVLLERLEETLPDRIFLWRSRPGGAPKGRLAVTRQIADATAYLHARGIVFCDLKPDNVGFDHAGSVKLFDFGFAAGLPAKDAQNPEGLLYDRCGTPRYMAPEVGLSHGYNAKADVYSLGILLWEMCALAKPFAAINAAAKFEQAVFEEGLRPDINKGWPPAVKQLMRSCWAADPSQRPAMAEVKASLAVTMASSDF